MDSNAIRLPFARIPWLLGAKEAAAGQYRLAGRLRRVMHYRPPKTEKPGFKPGFSDTFHIKD
jgi:hypothetical protein